MKHLLDVNVLLASVWANHSRHMEAFVWVEGKNIELYRDSVIIAANRGAWGDSVCGNRRLNFSAIQI